MKFKFINLVVLSLSISSCIGTKSSLKNVDDKSPILKLNVDNTFVITQFSKDEKYGFDKDYPINIFYKNVKEENVNQKRFLEALAGPNGEKIFYKKLENCCPFPTKKTEIGAGFLDVYEITWEGQKSPIKLYLNIYEKGILMIPVGMSLKK